MPRSAVPKLRLQGLPCARGAGRVLAPRASAGGEAGAGNSPGRESCTAHLPKAQALLPFGVPNGGTPHPSWRRTFLFSTQRPRNSTIAQPFQPPCQTLPGLERGPRVRGRHRRVSGPGGDLSDTSVASSKPYQRPPSTPQPPLRAQTGRLQAPGSLCQGNSKKKECGVSRCPLPRSHGHHSP